MKQSNSPKLRLSHSFLNLWSKGKYEDAIDLYFHKAGEGSKYMEDGKKIHEEWATTIKKDKKLVVGRTTLVFDHPEVEFSKTVDYNELFELKGVFDCIDKGTIYEWKTGKQDLSFYMNSYQIPLYFVISRLAGIKIEKAVILLYNQYINKCEVGVIWNNREAREAAENFIDTLAPEIHEYFIKHKLPFEKEVK